MGEEGIEVIYYYDYKQAKVHSRYQQEFHQQHKNFHQLIRQ